MFTNLHSRCVSFILSLTIIPIHTYPSFPAVINITRRSDLTNHNDSDTACECHSREIIVIFSSVLQTTNSPTIYKLNIIIS